MREWVNESDGTYSLTCTYTSHTRWYPSQRFSAGTYISAVIGNTQSGVEVRRADGHEAEQLRTRAARLSLVKDQNADSSSQ